MKTSKRSLLMLAVSILLDIFIIYTFLNNDFSFIIFNLFSLTILNSIALSIICYFLLIPILFLNMVKFSLMDDLKIINYSNTISFGLFLISYFYLFLNNEPTFFIGLYIFSFLISISFFPNTNFGRKLIKDSENVLRANSIDENTDSLVSVNEMTTEDVKSIGEISENLLYLHIIDSYYSDEYSKCIYYCNLSIKNFGYSGISLTKRAESLENLGYYLNAIKDYELHLEVNGKDPNINGLIGSLYFEICLFDEAKRNLIIAIDGGYKFYESILQLVKVSCLSEIASNFRFEEAKKNGFHELIDTETFNSLDFKIRPLNIVAKSAILCLEKKKSENNTNAQLYDTLINYVNHSVHE